MFFAKTSFPNPYFLSLRNFVSLNEVAWSNDWKTFSPAISIISSPKAGTPSLTIFWLPLLTRADRLFQFRPPANLSSPFLASASFFSQSLIAGMSVLKAALPRKSAVVRNPSSLQTRAAAHSLSFFCCSFPLSSLFFQRRREAPISPPEVGDASLPFLSCDQFVVPFPSFSFSSQVKSFEPPDPFLSLFPQPGFQRSRFPPRRWGDSLFFLDQCFDCFLFFFFKNGLPRVGSCADSATTPSLGGTFYLLSLVGLRIFYWTARSRSPSETHSSSSSSFPRSSRRCTILLTK